MSRLRRLTKQSWLLFYIGALTLAFGLPLALTGAFLTATGAILLIAEFTGLTIPAEQIPPGWVVFERGPCGHPIKYRYAGPALENATPTFFIPLTAQLETDGPYVPTCRRCSYVSDFVYSYRPPQPLLPGDAPAAPAV